MARLRFTIRLAVPCPFPVFWPFAEKRKVLIR
jgi:hypothetical protein